MTLPAPPGIGHTDDQRVYDTGTGATGTVHLNAAATDGAPGAHVLWDAGGRRTPVTPDRQRTLAALDAHPLNVAGVTLHGYRHGQRVRDTGDDAPGTVHLAESAGRITGDVLWDDEPGELVRDELGSALGHIEPVEPEPVPAR